MSRIALRSEQLRFSAECDKSEYSEIRVPTGWNVTASPAGLSVRLSHVPSTVPVTRIGSPRTDE
jgi:hypothetical protein